jgi:hypothetical protein
MLTSLIDDDGWKELSLLAFYRPPLPPRDTPPWQRQMVHDWGVLGRWSGVTLIQPQGDPSAAGEQTFAYTHRMTYTPPGEKAVGLPFRLLEAHFEPVTAGGTMVYHPQTERVRLVSEQFHVRGKLSAMLLEQSTDIQLEEVQTLRVELSEQR